MKKFGTKVVSLSFFDGDSEVFRGYELALFMIEYVQPS